MTTDADLTRCQNCGAVILTTTVECGRCLTRQAPDVSVRYLLVELPIDEQLDVEQIHTKFQQDLNAWLWDDADLVEQASVSLIYPGDVVPGGESDG